MISILNSVLSLCYMRWDVLKNYKINLICSIFTIHIKFHFHHFVLCDEMNQIRSHLYMFSKNKLTHRCFKSSPSNCSNWIDRVNFFLFFGPIRFASAQLTLSPPFPLPGVASHSPNIVTPLHHVTLPFHWTKTSSLPPLYFSIMVHRVASPPLSSRRG